MFKFCSLYSGSTGNSLFVETPNTKILIDAGESAKKIVSALSNICVDIENIDAILVTHEHSDHVKGLGIPDNVCIHLNIANNDRAIVVVSAGVQKFLESHSTHLIVVF